MVIQRRYKKKLPPKIIKLIEWLITASHFRDYDSFDDMDGRAEYMTFQLSFSKTMIIIDKDNHDNIIFRLEVEHE